MTVAQDEILGTANGPRPPSAVGHAPRAEPGRAAPEYRQQRPTRAVVRPRACPCRREMLARTFHPGRCPPRPRAARQCDLFQSVQSMEVFFFFSHFTDFHRFG